MGKKLVLAITLAAPAAAFSAQPAARLDAGVQAADAAIAALQGRLSARLMAELKQGGPARAVTVCRDEAAALTAEVARAQGIRVGRTSHKLRNAGNTPPPWAERFVAAAAGARSGSVKGEVVDLGDRVGVLRPIATAAPCLQCHGASDRVSPETAALLKAAYPGDQAVGFAEGDVRGFFWAEAPLAQASKEPAAAAPATEAKARKEGEKLLTQANPRCTMCHSVAGKGNASGAPLDGVGTRLSRDEIKAWIRTPREMAQKRGSTRKPAMVPFPEFTDEEVEALVTYLVSLKAKAPGK